MSHYHQIQEVVVFKMTCLGQSQITLSHSICDKLGDLHELVKMRQGSLFILGLPTTINRGLHNFLGTFNKHQHRLHSS